MQKVRSLGDYISKNFHYIDSLEKFLILHYFEFQGIGTFSSLVTSFLTYPLPFSTDKSSAMLHFLAGLKKKLFSIPLWIYY